MRENQRGEEVTSAEFVTNLIGGADGLLADAARNYRGAGSADVRALFELYREKLRAIPAGTAPEARSWLRDAASGSVMKQFLADHNLVFFLLKVMWGWTDEEVARYAGNRQQGVSAGAGFKVEYLDPGDPAARDRLRKEHAILPGATMMIGDPPRPFSTGTMTSKASGPGWAIFVMDADGRIYAGEHRVGLFHHSSFLAGAGVAAAGELKVTAGRLREITAKSGHYRPTPEETHQFLRRLAEAGVPLEGVVVKTWEPRERDSNVTVTRTYDAHDFLLHGTRAERIGQARMLE